MNPFMVLIEDAEGGREALGSFEEEEEAWSRAMAAVGAFESILVCRREGRGAWGQKRDWITLPWSDCHPEEARHLDWLYDGLLAEAATAELERLRGRGRRRAA